MTEAVSALRRGGLPEADQQALLDLFTATAEPEALPLIATLVRTEKNETRRAKRLAALGGYDDPAAAEVILENFSSFTPRLQSTAQRMLSERPAWAQVMLTRMNAGTFDPSVVSSANLAAIRAHKDPRLISLLTSYQQKHSEDPVRRAAQAAYETGKTAFNLTCAPCHQESGGGLAMLAPALVGSRWLQTDDAVLARIILQGKENPGRGLVMPPWRQFDDAHVAAILTYVRREFGGQAEAVAPAKIAEVRAATTGRQKAWTDAELDALAVQSKRN
jgi:mono/diheme cytochrome c family protein